MSDGQQWPTRCRWFGHKLDYVFRFADSEKDYRACSRCGARSMLYTEEGTE